MDAVLIAGGTPQPDDPLYPYTQGRPKALLDLNGQPMAQWTLDALAGSARIERILIVGLEHADDLHSPKVVGCLPDHGDILSNIQAGVRHFYTLGNVSRHVTVASSDIPAILPQHVDWVVDTAMQTDLDVYYNMITRQTMEKRYPGSHRTYLRLKDAEVCGGDLNVVRAETVQGNDEMWRRIIASRKSPLHQAALFGYGTLLWILLRRLTVQDALQRVAARLHLTGQVLPCPYAEVGMDIDKPHQLEMMQRDLAARSAAGIA